MAYDMLVVAALLQLKTPATLDELLDGLPPQNGSRPDAGFRDALRATIDELERGGWLGRDDGGRLFASADQVAVAERDARLYGTVRESAGRRPHIELPAYARSEDA
jgi:hypothetical protein